MIAITFIKSPSIEIIMHVKWMIIEVLFIVMKNRNTPDVHQKGNFIKLCHLNIIEKYAVV